MRSRRSAAGSGGRGPLTCHDGHAIGLDIGATAVRATVLAVRQRDGSPVVEAQSVSGVDLPAGTVVGGVVVDRPTLTGALEELWRTSRLKCRNVVVGVAGPQVLVRELQMPALDAAQRRKALPFQARELVAMPLDQVVLDFTPLGPPDVGTGTQQGLLIACPREPVLAAVAAVEAARLRVVRVDLASLALLRSVADGRSRVEVVVDLGAHLSTVVVHEDGVPRLVRTLSRGGDELTAGLADRLGMTLADAEAAKRRSGLASGDPVSSGLRELVTPLMAELRSSLNYFRTTHPAAPVARVALTGGGSRLAGFPELLSEQIGAVCEVVDPSRLLAPPSRSRTVVEPGEWSSALSIGLAIGAAA